MSSLTVVLLTVFSVLFLLDDQNESYTSKMNSQANLAMDQSKQNPTSAEMNNALHLGSHGISG